jgi:hypothetical protein
VLVENAFALSFCSNIRITVVVTGKICIPVSGEKLAMDIEVL